MTDILDSSARNDGNSPILLAPPTNNDLTGILASLAKGHEAMQDTIRQLAHTLQVGSLALYIHKNMPPPPPRTSRHATPRLP